MQTNAAELAPSTTSAHVSPARGPGPLAQALLAAIEVASERQAEYNDCACATCADVSSGNSRRDCNECAALVASLAADEAVVAARQALISSTEEIEWDVSEEGNHYDTVWASSAAEALELAITDYDASCYGDVQETFRVTIRVSNDLIDEADSGSVTIDPPAPACADDCEHDWRSPYSVVGGDRSNPGVWGSGHGHCRSREVCAHCGIYRVVDGGGTDSSDGTRLTTTRYEDADQASLAWVAERAGQIAS